MRVTLTFRVYSQFKGKLLIKVLIERYFQMRETLNSFTKILGALPPF